MRNDEGNVRVFGGDQLNHGDFAHDIANHGQGKLAGGLADFARDARVAMMNLDAAKSELFLSLAHKCTNTSPISRRVDERETKEPVRPTRHDACDLPIGRPVI